MCFLAQSKLTAGGFDYEDIQPLHNNDNGHPGLIKHFALACAALLAVPSYHLYSNLPPSKYFHSYFDNKSRELIVKSQVSKFAIHFPSDLGPGFHTGSFTSGYIIVTLFLSV